MSLVARLAARSAAEIREAQVPNLPAWARQRNQPATYPRIFLEVAAERGVSPAVVLARAGLPDTLLDDPAGRVTFLEIGRILQSVRELTGDDALGFETGFRLPLTAHGSLGYALMCAATPRRAIEILERFWHLRGRGAVLQVHEQGDGLFFEVLSEASVPVALRDFLLPSMLTSMWQGMRFIMPALPMQPEIWLQGSEPAGFALIRERLPLMRFDMPSAGIRLAGGKAFLEQALSTANPEGLAQALAQCERESALIGDAADPVLAHTRAALQLDANGYPTPERIASTLHITLRTFRRRLQEQGSSYRQLLEEARQRDSRHLLEKPGLEIRRISELLGYADPANFTRAFKGWTGETPREWRLKRQQ